MTTIDYTLLSNDIYKKINKESIKTRDIMVHAGFSKTTYYRIKNGQSINMDTFLFVVNWLNKDVNRYFRRNIYK